MNETGYGPYVGLVLTLCMVAMIVAQLRGAFS